MMSRHIINKIKYQHHLHLLNTAFLSELVLVLNIVCGAWRHSWCIIMRIVATSKYSVRAAWHARQPHQDAWEFPPLWYKAERNYFISSHLQDEQLEILLLRTCGPLFKSYIYIGCKNFSCLVARASTFLRWHLIFVGPQFGTCCLQPF